MDKKTLISELKKKLDLDIYVSQATADPSLLPLLLEIVETEKSAAKFLAEKIIREVSQRDPGLLYPHFERVAQQLDSANAFIKWGFILTLPNLLKVDVENKWEKVSQRFLALLESDSVVTFGSAVAGVWKILERYPQHEKEIVPRLLNIDQHIFLYKGEFSPECINVAKGQIIDCFEAIYPASQYQEPMRAFGLANLDNSRSKVRSKAKRFLTKIG